MRIKICGIDPSLSSTGFAMAFCDFSECYRCFLSSLLFADPVSGDFLKEFSKCVDFSVMSEIHEIKPHIKELAKVRKEIRESVEPSIELIQRVNIFEVSRLVWQASEIDRYLTKLDPDLVFIEDYSYHSRGSTTQLAELRGCLKTFLFNNVKQPRRFKYLVAPITSVKKIGGTKGNATKPLMCEGMKRFGFDLDVADDDKVDAMAIVVTAFYSMYYRMFGLDVPKEMKKADRNSWDKALRTFANRIGTKDEMESWIR